MTSPKTILSFAAAAALCLGVAAPSVSMASQQGRNTLTGGLVGAGAGAVLTHGSVGGTLVGAGAGALIGNSLGHGHRRSYHRSYHRDYRRGY